MKKVIGIALVMVIALAVMAGADANNWILKVKGTMPDGTASMTVTQIGWGYTKTDGKDTGEGGSLPPIGALGYDAAVVSKLADGAFSTVDYRTALSKGAALPITYNMYAWWRGAAKGDMLITLFTGTNAAQDFPYSPDTEIVVAAGDQKYVFNSENKFSTSGFSFTLPGITATAAGTNPDFTITVQQVPEPGSMLALGSGLVGLVGFAIRRRK